MTNSSDYQLALQKAKLAKHLDKIQKHKNFLNFILRIKKA